LKRWKSLGRDGSPSRPSESTRKRTDKSFLVPKSEIADNDYDLSINRYKEVEYEEVHYDSPKEILSGLQKLENEIAKGMKELGEML
jgi:type I restriction enzyme M protein